MSQQQHVVHVVQNVDGTTTLTIDGVDFSGQVLADDFRIEWERPTDRQVGGPQSVPVVHMRVRPTQLTVHGRAVLSVSVDERGEGR